MLQAPNLMMQGGLSGMPMMGGGMYGMMPYGMGRVSKENVHFTISDISYTRVQGTLSALTLRQ